MNNQKLFLTTFCCIALLFCEARVKYCSVEVDISPGMDKNKLNYYFYNGIKGINVIPSAKTVISDSVCYMYAILTISFKGGGTGSKYYTFYISEKRAKINLKQIIYDSGQWHLSYKTINAWPAEKISNRLAGYTEIEQKKYDLALSRNNLDSAYWFAYKDLIGKKMSFIKKNSRSYYSLLLFSTLCRIRFPAEFRHMLDSLYPFYMSTFGYGFRNSQEGREIEERLRRNMLVLDEGMKMPEFCAMDFMGNRIDSRRFRGKYLLINFWASWCGPCMAELPAIKKIRDKFAPDMLEILSVSYDDDSTVFIGNIVKYKLDWIHLFRNDEISEALGVSGRELPQLFLVDKVGMVIYSRSSEKETNREKLDYLNALLNAEMKRQ